MAFEVLKSPDQIRESRRKLRRQGLSCATPNWLAFLYQRQFLRGIRIGDDLKSWDVLRTVSFLESHVAKNEPILDIGAYASEMPCILHRLGYSKVAGIDLNPDVLRMPYSKSVNYRVGNFMQTDFLDRFFTAITAISVIEHGFDARALFAELSRLLKSGGYFIASFDYWPQKISTDGIDLFGMSWTIFSRSEVEDFTEVARSYGFRPFASSDFESADRPINCMERDYTFAWMALVRA